MTLNLKLVRHHDGKWTALTPETDELSQVSNKEKKCAPIDPASLLKALDSVLSPDCGIKDIKDVERVACLMKKFSKKLVSRCVYCNVLQATKTDILSDFLEKGGWETINIWLQYAKSSSSCSFLLELLKLCKLLPMSLDRLKENNTAKLIKSLTKHENSEIKSLSSELVSKWMSIIKVKKAGEISNDKKKKKEKSEKVEPPKEDVLVKPIPESPKTSLKLKGLKRTSTEQECKKEEIYEDVKIDPEPLLPASKKPRPDRPKTAKIYQKKFRATGLEEETPLPKNVKKNTTIDKTAAVAAAKSTLKLNSSMSLERITEKKIKPESLMAVNENANTKGIKLIPAKPRPTYVLHESASFMDALISQPTIQPVKRKKKQKANTASSPNAHNASSPNHSASSPTTSSPTSPAITPPKFQFYKDTLEMKEEADKKDVKDEKVKDEEVKDEDVIIKEEPSENTDSVCEPMDTTEEGGHTPPNNETTNTSDDFESKNDVLPPFDPNNLRSIMSCGKRKGKKKSVHWVEDENIKEIKYFDMDETERVNVSRNSSFYDLKSIEMKREREAMEMAKRHPGEEFGRWWTVPILIDIPPPPIPPGRDSIEKHNEIIRQQATLQEIYFTKEMIPDSPHEPDLEIHPPKEPVIIPFDEDNVISTVLDYSNYKQLPASLPDILSTLMKITTSQPPIAPTQDIEPEVEVKVPVETFPAKTEPPPVVPGPEPVIHSPLNGFLGHNSLPFNGPPHPEGMVMQMPVEWRGPPPEMVPLDTFYPGFPMNHPNMPHPNHFPPPQPQGINIGPPGGPPNFRCGPLPPRMGVRPPRRKVCRHFAASHCRYGFSCAFLHPGVNGPPI